MSIERIAGCLSYPAPNLNVRFHEIGLLDCYMPHPTSDANSWTGIFDMDDDALKYEVPAVIALAVIDSRIRLQPSGAGCS